MCTYTCKQAQTDMHAVYSLEAGAQESLNTDTQIRGMPMSTMSTVSVTISSTLDPPFMLQDESNPYI